MIKSQFPGIRTTISYKRLLTASIALIVFFLLLTSVIGLAEKYFAIKSRTRDLKAQQATLVAKQEALTEQNAYLATPDGAAQSLRGKFNVVQPGEGMIIITTPPDPVLVVPEPQSKVSRWWEVILRGLGIRRD